jgi:hypothetical protein
LDAEPNPATGSAAAPLPFTVGSAAAGCGALVLSGEYKRPAHAHRSQPSPPFSPFPHSQALPTHDHLDPPPGSTRASALVTTIIPSSSYKNFRAAVSFSFILIVMPQPPPARHTPSKNFGKSTS